MSWSPAPQQSNCANQEAKQSNEYMITNLSCIMQNECLIKREIIISTERMQYDCIIIIIGKASTWYAYIIVHKIGLYLCH